MTSALIFTATCLAQLAWASEKEEEFGTYSPGSTSSFPDSSSPADILQDETPKTLLGRLTAYNWRNEVIILGFIVVFTALHFFGRFLNRRKLNRWLDAHKPVLEENFYQVGVHARGNPEKLLDEVQQDEFVTYATGRDNISWLRATLSLKGRQNEVTLAIEYLFAIFYSYEFWPQDVVEIEIAPSDNKQDKSSYDPFVFGVVAKGVMQKARKEKYYLSLTRTSDNKLLPRNLAVMSEAAEITDILLTPELVSALSLDQNESFFQYLTVTDQPSDRPENESDASPPKRLYLRMLMPDSAESLEHSAAVLRATIKLVDILVEKAHFRYEVNRKIKTTREEELKKIRKNAETKLAEERADAKAEEKRKERAELSNQSRPAQRKAAQKEQSKELRKQRKQMNRRA